MHLGLINLSTPWLVCLSCCFCLSNVHAHEYWLDPIDSIVSIGESVIVDVRNGQNFSGVSFPYDGSKFAAVEVSSPSGTQSYKGRLGDYPAFHQELTEAGLYSISVDTNPQLLVYKSWDQFTTFLSYHALDDIAMQHRKRGLPTTDIKERYFRSAKTLVQANETGDLNPQAASQESVSSQTAFMPSGAKFEMVLLDNPYGAILEVRAKLFYNDKPLAGRQAEMFWKGSHEIRLTTSTDENGVATFKLLGDGDYLLNAVHVVAPENEDVDWVSRWASITFER